MAREVQVTREGYERLQRALEREQERRAEVIRARQDLLDDAMDLEDRSLQAAQNDTSALDARIVELEDTLARAVVVDHPADASRIALGSIVVLHDDDRDQDIRVHLVSAVETSVLAEGETQVADDSPVGKAIAGKSVGDSIAVDLGDHQKHYTIKRIE